MRAVITAPGTPAFALALTLVAGGCDREESGSRLEVRWTGADTGAFLAPLEATWCAAGRHVEIRATRGDTGVAVALFPRNTARRDSARSGTVRSDSARPDGTRGDSTRRGRAGGDSARLAAIRASLRARSAPPDTTPPPPLAGAYSLLAAPMDSSRPAAAVAVRWSDPNSVAGFRSDSGTVVLRVGPDGKLAGEIKAAGPLLGGLRRRLAVSGRFEGLAVVPAPPTCSPLLVPPRDSGVDSGHGNPVRNAPPRPPRADLLPQRLRPQGGRGGPPQRRLP